MSETANVPEEVFVAGLRALYHAPPEGTPTTALLLDMHGPDEGLRAALAVAYAAGRAELKQTLLRLVEAEAVIVNAQDQLYTDHPVWWILDDYDGSMDSVKTLKAERDAARAELADKRAAHKTASDAANRFRDVLADALGYPDSNPGDDVLIARLRASHARTGPEPTRWRDLLADVEAKFIDQPVGCDFCRLDKWTYVQSKAEGFVLDHDEGR